MTFRVHKIKPIWNVIETVSEVADRTEEWESEYE